MKSILFVCTGNICRSPTAEGVLRHKLEQAGMRHIRVDSAGTHGYHIGEPPDVRSVLAARKRGVQIDELRSRRVSEEDFYAFDLILGLDKGHVRLLERIAPKTSSASAQLFLEYASGMRDKDVPDPYYGTANEFEHVLDLIETGCDALIKKLQDDRG